MKKLKNVFKVFQYVMLGITIVSPCLYAQAIETATLTVVVEDLRNADGVVQFSLYNKKGSIPDEYYTKYVYQQKKGISHSRAITVFKNIPIAEYAVNILHDENNNGKIDKGFLLPIEGIGFSHYSTINLFNQPNFKDASLELNSDKNIRVKIIYF